MIGVESTNFYIADIAMKILSDSSDTKKEVGNMDAQLKTILELIAQPAFLATDGMISWCNTAASSLLSEGTPVYSILENEDSLFSHWPRSGSLNLSVFLGGCEYEATVLPCGESDLFITTERASELNAEARAISNASAPLRKQLHSIVNAADSLFEQLPEQYSGSEAAAQLNQSIYRFIRLCSQMSDGSQLFLGTKGAQKERIDLKQFLAAFVDHATSLISSVGISLVYEACPNQIKADVDPALLERALYNLLTNAITYTAKGGTVTLKTEKQDSLFLISMSDDGEGLSPAVSSTLFRRFSEYRIGDSRRGIGLGLPIVREIARLHGGSLTVTGRADHTGTVATFSISLAPAPIELRSNRLRYDYGGEFDRGLIELSEVLDAKMYAPNEVQ